MVIRNQENRMTGEQKVVCGHTKSEKPYDWRAKSCSWSYEEAARSKQSGGLQQTKKRRAASEERSMSDKSGKADA